MANGGEMPIKLMVSFGVRNDKNRGILIESMETSGNVYFFKSHDQPLHCHCQQVQNIVKSQNVLRAKKVHIDVTEFLFEYFQPKDDGFEVQFRATKLLSTHNHMEKVYITRINKEIGIVKRMQTIANNKQAKIIEKNRSIQSKFVVAENAFQIERARRIALLFNGRPSVSQVGPSQGRPSQGGPSQGGPSQGGQSQGGPSQGGPSQGGPSQGGPSQGGPSQGGPSQGGPSQGGPSQGGSYQGEQFRGEEQPLPSDDDDMSN